MHHYWSFKKFLKTATFKGTNYILNTVKIQQKYIKYEVNKLCMQKYLFNLHALLSAINILYCLFAGSVCTGFLLNRFS